MHQKQYKGIHRSSCFYGVAKGHECYLVPVFSSENKKNMQFSDVEQSRTK